MCLLPLAIACVTPDARGGDRTAGQAIYVSVCSSCHGLDGIGTLKYVPSFKKCENLDKDDAKLLVSVRDGVGGRMPPWGVLLSDREIDDAIAYARTFCSASPPVAAQPISLHSEASRFAVRVAGIDNPERVNHLHGFDLSIAAADGRPVTGAIVSFAGQHRYAGNPLPTAPHASPADGPGNYRVEGLRFHMPGEWRLALEIEFEHIRDRVTLDIVVK